MARTLIPRSDSVSAKIIEPSDFENLFTSDIVQNYVVSGFTLSAGSGLNVNVAAGVIRFKGLYLENDATESVGALSASTTNPIYVRVARDGNGEAESWSFVQGSSSDSFHIGNAVTDGSSVTSVTYTTSGTWDTPTVATKPGQFGKNTSIGVGTAGDILYSTGTKWTKIPKGSDGQYLKLASGIPTWAALDDQIGNVTHQHGGPVWAGTANGSMAKLGSTLTVATRANGKYSCILNLRQSQGTTAQNTADFELRVNGTMVEEWTHPHRGQDITHTILLGGVLDGDTIELWGFHPWSTHNNVGASTGGGYSIWEWSET